MLSIINEYNDNYVIDDNEYNELMNIMHDKIIVNINEHLRSVFIISNRKISN